MKLRYYMRGLGIGIFVTAILMSVTLNGKTEQLTDAEIIERAKTLGMEEKYETTVLADTVEDKETDETSAETSDGQQTETSAETADGQQSETPAETSDGQQTETSAETSGKPQPQEIVTDKTIKITVSSGDGSGTVARKLAEAGIIEDATDYDKFLCANGYDKRIRVGTYNIPANATDEEIAKIITTRNN